MCPLAGIIGDRIGRRPTMLIGAGGVTLTAIPTFLLLATGDWTLGIIGLALLAFFEALANVMLGVLMVELFPAHLRVTRSSIDSNSAQSLIGGPGPFVAASIAAASTTTAAPAAYLVVVGTIAFCTLCRWLPETCRRNDPDRTSDALAAHQPAIRVGRCPAKDPVPLRR
jgi:MHS family proline/betaine transporter-like MFS transporter